MTFRVTPNSWFSQALQAAALHTSQLSKLQQQASTGVRLLKPSDDPQAMKATLQAQLQDSRLTTELANINAVKNRLNTGVAQLTDANDIFARARQIALQGNQATDPTELEVLAKDVDRLLERLVAIANSQVDGEYLFGGASMTSQPFVVSGDLQNGESVTVRYDGSDQPLRTVIGADTSYESLYSGADAFLGRSRGQTLIIGTTGAAAGAGTDTATGTGTLEVRHTATSYAAGSGVAAGTQSATGDTILGPAGSHVLHLVDTSGTGASGTVSLNGGTTVTFTNAMTNLAVVGPGGETVYIDTSTITAGFSGDIAITATGSLSVDGGRTVTPINFSANQQVTDSLTGAVTNIDSSAIRRTGTDQVEYQGTADAFQTLLALRDDLRNTRQLSTSQLHDAMARRLTDLDRVSDNILQVVGEQSVQLENLDALAHRAQDLQVTAQQNVSDNSAADMAQVAIRLQNEQLMLQFTYAAVSRLLQQSFLDFIS
jgi:flagellar hook-associated protein 3